MKRHQAREHQARDLTRRAFVRESAAGAVALSLIGCGPPTSTTGDGGGGNGGNCPCPEDGGTGQDAGPVQDAGPDDVGDGGMDLTCGETTDPNLEGPFFTPDSPERAALAMDGDAGQRLRITGRVFTPDCEPVAGATLDFWQANDDGDYDNVGFTFRGHQFADESGQYQLDTIIPGRYPNAGTFRPSHIHVKVTAPSLTLLTTQLYFAGDPFNAADPFLLSSLIMALSDGPDGRKDAVFNFVVRAS